MTERNIPPFRADHVGSLLRPAVLKNARDRFATARDHRPASTPGMRVSRRVGSMSTACKDDWLSASTFLRREAVWAILAVQAFDFVSQYLALCCWKYPFAD